MKLLRLPMLFTALAIVLSTTAQAQCWTTCPGDYNGDGTITANDLTQFHAYLADGDMCADVNETGNVSAADLTTMLFLFGTSCPCWTTCPGDYNGDGNITASDLTQFHAYWADGDMCADVNESGNVSASDVTAMLFLFGTSCPCWTTCPGDYNGDGNITANDWTAFLGFYGNLDMCADFNEDGVVNVQDYIAMRSALGSSCSKGRSKELALNQHDLSVYPNPVDNTLFIKHDLSQVVDARIVDNTGRIVKQLNSNAIIANRSVDTSELTSGVYVLLIQDEQIMHRATFVKR